MSKAIPIILNMLAYKIDAPEKSNSGTNRPPIKSLWEGFKHVGPYICEDYDPWHSSLGKHELLVQENNNLGHLCYFEDLSWESSMQLWKTNSTIWNRDPRTTDKNSINKKPKFYKILGHKH